MTAKRAECEHCGWTTEWVADSDEFIVEARWHEQECEGMVWVTTDHDKEPDE